jgi:hypothetical protein
LCVGTIRERRVSCPTNAPVLSIAMCFGWTLELRFRSCTAFVKTKTETFSYRAGTVGDVCERSDGTNLSYRVRAKRIATIAARIATAA